MRYAILAECVLSLAGMVLLTDWFAETARGRIVNLRASRQLEQTVLAARSAPPGTAAIRRAAAPQEGIPSGSPIGRIEIASIGLSTVIIEGVDDRELTAAVGHIPGTALPGEPGNAGLAGHRDSYFRHLGRLHANDRITISTAAGRFSYLVESTKVVSPGDVNILRPTRGGTLTLVTCFPFRYVGPAPRRFVVTARLASDGGPPASAAAIAGNGLKPTSS